jgi:ENTH domain
MYLSSKLAPQCRVPHRGCSRTSPVYLSYLCRGPTGTLLNELAEATFNPTDCEIVFVSRAIGVAGSIYVCLSELYRYPFAVFVSVAPSSPCPLLLLDPSTLCSALLPLCRVSVSMLCIILSFLPHIFQDFLVRFSGSVFPVCFLFCINYVFRQTPPSAMQAVIELRLGYPAAKWRNVYKALTVLEFLLKRGSEQGAVGARLSVCQSMSLQSPGLGHAPSLGLHLRRLPNALSPSGNHNEAAMQSRQNPGRIPAHHWNE